MTPYSTPYWSAQRAARALWLVGLMAWVALSASAQSDTTSPSGDDRVFIDTTRVVLINVDIWVVNREGRPVTGLSADDFIVLEDGEPVEVTHFAELRGGERVAHVPEGIEAIPEESSRDVSTRPATPRDDPGHLIVYIDEIHLSPPSRRAAFRALRQFIADAAVPPHRISILRQSEELVTAAPFGSTEQELFATLDALEKRRARSRETDRKRRLLVQEIQRIYDDALHTPSADSPCKVTHRRSRPLIQQHALESAARVVGTLGHLWNTADYLAGLPGTKALIYLGEGLEMVPGSAHLRFLEELCSPTEATDNEALTGYALQDRYRAFTRHANSARITVHALDVGGLRTSGGFDVESGVTTRVGASSTFDRVHGRDLQSGLNVLADDTGGRAVFHRNQIADSLDAIARDLGSRYSVAYSPPTPGDGEQHTIEVRLRDELRGLQIRHRRDYRGRSADERLAAKVRTALFAGFVENPLGAHFRWGQAGDGGETGILLPLQVQLPVEAVTFLPEGDLDTARLTLLAAARNDDGETVSFSERKPVIERPPADMATIPLRIDVEVPPGDYVIAVAVRDDITGSTSVLASSLRLARTANDETSSP